MPETTPPPTARRDQRIRTLLAVAVTGLILALLLLPLSPRALADAFARIGLLPVLLVALVAVIDGLPVEVDKLRRTCRHLGIPLTYRQSAALSLPATALAAVLPAQAEELVKARQLSLLKGVGFEEAVGTILLDRGYNLGGHIVLLSGSLAAMAAGATGPRALVAGLAVGGATCALGVLLVALAGRWSDRVAWLKDRPLTRALRTARPSFNAWMVLYCGLVQAALAGSLAVMAGAAGLAVPFAAVLAWRTGATLFAKIPVSIGGFGLRVGALALGLAAFGSAPAAVASALLFGVVSVLVPSLAAFAFYPLLARTLGHVRDDLARAGRLLTDW